MYFDTLTRSKLLEIYHDTAFPDAAEAAIADTAGMPLHEAYVTTLERVCDEAPIDVRAFDPFPDRVAGLQARRKFLYARVGAVYSRYQNLHHIIKEKALERSLQRHIYACGHPLWFNMWSGIPVIFSFGREYSRFTTYFPAKSKKQSRKLTFSALPGLSDKT